jgi:hypothetical protein
VNTNKVGRAVDVLDALPDNPDNKDEDQQDNMECPWCNLAVPVFGPLRSTLWLLGTTTTNTGSLSTRSYLASNSTRHRFIYCQIELTILVGHLTKVNIFSFLAAPGMGSILFSLMEKETETTWVIWRIEWRNMLLITF